MAPEGFGDVNAVVLGFGEGQLQGAEESGGARDGDRDEAQLAEERLPLLLANVGCGG